VPQYYVMRTLPLLLGTVNTTSKCEPGSSVGIVTDYELDVPGSNPGGDEIFPHVQIGPGAHPASCKNGYRVFPGGKVRPGRAADHSPASSATVMEE